MDSVDPSLPTFLERNPSTISDQKETEPIVSKDELPPKFTSMTSMEVSETLQPDETVKDLKIKQLEDTIEKMQEIQDGLLRQVAMIFGNLGKLQEEMKATTEVSVSSTSRIDKLAKAMREAKAAIRDQNSQLRAPRAVPSKSDPARGGKSSSQTPKRRTSKSSRSDPGKKKSMSPRHPDPGLNAPKVAPSRKKTINFGTRKIVVVEPSEIPEEAHTLPKSELKLVYAHGYNGHDPKVRNNLYKRNGELIYNIAGSVVMHNVETNSQRHFLEHTEDVTSIALHPTKNIMATGQQDEKGVAEPRVCIWDLDTMKCIKVHEGFHQGFVYFLEWSSVSGHLYSCDGSDGHQLVVFDGEDLSAKRPLFKHSPISKSDVYGLAFASNVEEGNIDEFMSYGKKHLKSWAVTLDSDRKQRYSSRHSSPFAVKGHLIATAKKSEKRESHYQSVIALPSMPGVFAAGGSSGVIYLVANNKVKARLQAYEVSVACLVAMEDVFFSSSYQGEWIIWKPSGDSFEPTMRGDFLSVPGIKGVGTPRSLLYDAETCTLYVGSRKNQIFTTTLSQAKPAVDGSDEGAVGSDLQGKVIVHGHGGEIWGLATHPTEPFFVTGGHDGYLNAYSVEDSTPLFDKQISFGKEKICYTTWSSDGKWIAVGTEESKIHIVAWEPFQEVQEIKIDLKSKNNEIEQVGCLLFNPESNLLVAGHFDSTIYLYGLDAESGKWGRWKHAQSMTSAVTHLQFSADGKHLKSFGRDYYLQTWEILFEKQRLRQEKWELDPDTTPMTGDPIIAGWDVQGLLQPGMDGTDINTTGLTRGGEERLMVAGDDFGKVWLHKYPSMHSKFSKGYSGHSAFVCDVKWTHDDSKVISVGGGDRAILVWERHSSESEI